MGTTAIEVVDNLVFCDSCKQAPRPVFYKNSGIFDLSGTLLRHGRFDTAVIRQIQAELGRKDVLLVVDLQDTWLPSFTSTIQQERVIECVLNRSPFLITSKSVFYVAYSPTTFGVKKLVVGDLDIRVLNRKTAKSKIMSALAD